MLRQSETSYTWSLIDLEIGSTVALQNPQTKHWDIYGKIANVGPNQRYHIKIGSGRVLVRNRRFLRHRTLTSCVPFTAQQINPARSSRSPPASQLPSLEAPQPPSQPRRSQRPRKPHTRLIEDPSWI